MLVYRSAVGPLAPLGAPVRKPFLALRAIVLRVLMRPLPVVFLRFAFSLQLSASYVSPGLDAIRRTIALIEEGAVHFLIEARG